MKNYKWQMKENSLDKFLPKPKKKKSSVYKAEDVVVKCGDIRINLVGDTTLTASPSEDIDVEDIKKKLSKTIKEMTVKHSGSIWASCYPTLDNWGFYPPQRKEATSVSLDGTPFSVAHNVVYNICKREGLKWRHELDEYSHSPAHKIITSEPITNVRSLTGTYHELGHHFVENQFDTKELRMSRFRCNAEGLVTDIIVQNEVAASTWAINNHKLVDKAHLLESLHTYVKYSNISEWDKETKVKYLQFVILCGEDK